MADWSDLARNAGNTGMDAIQGVLKWAMENIPKLLSKLPDMFGSLFSKGSEVASNTVEAVAPQVTKLGSSAGQALGSAMQTPIAAVQDLPAKVGELTQGRGV